MWIKRGFRCRKNCSAHAREREGGRHGSQLAVERLVQAGLLQFLQVGKFALVEAAEVLGFFAEIGELPGNLPLLSRSNRFHGM
jgi:hypothetical protein